ncbi:hypothetical protein M3P05_20675 [Sansalvadorimonas sp. 2012CJ34-2]|uniref:DUF2975 domain-containing protein n=1 Tax=Parendozoicomonas callyspongiae TaxID=2942213 RepID=A0ABT0PLS0_9GAMM|nr:hypothetical protein [Sansalvadorimonas sp. 2012CJ34-2]MCL6272335.1 hypothetical protein [Sansalvadorimonas sp. 2012CJ34-2]
MLKQQITAIALKLLSIWLLIHVILNLPSVIILLANLEQHENQGISTVWYIVIISSILIIGLASVHLINKAANSVLSQENEHAKYSLSEDTQKLFLQIAGLYFIVTAIAYLPRSLLFLTHSIDISLSWDNFLYPAGLFFQLGIGLWLIGSSSFWAKTLHKLRGRA